MEKKLYELSSSEKLNKALPPLTEGELSLLTDSILSEGCREPIVVFNGTVIDGHNRYRICQEHNIPFAITEMEFEDEDEALLWIIKNQLGRRNIPDFVKGELVLPLEAQLREEAKKRMGRRKKEETLADLPNNNEPLNTRDTLAEIAGISSRTLGTVKKLIELADEDTLAKLRAGEISIHGAYKAIKDQEEKRKYEEAVRRSKEMDKEIASVMPGYGLAVPLPPREEGVSFRPPDSVLEIPPITVFGDMPADDPKYRGRAEMAYAKGELQKNTDYYTKRAGEILQWMTAASINPENIEILKGIIVQGYEKIMSLFDETSNEGDLRA